MNQKGSQQNQPQPQYPMWSITTPALTLSLRDWFAGQALPSVIRRAYETDCRDEHIAISAYAIADAMLIQRQKAKPNE